MYFNRSNETCSTERLRIEEEEDFVLTQEDMIKAGFSPCVACRIERLERLLPIIMSWKCL